MATWLRALILRRIVGALIVFVLAVAPAQILAATSDLPQASVTRDCDKPCHCEKSKPANDCAKLAACLVKCSTSSGMPQLVADLVLSFTPKQHAVAEPHPLHSAIAEPLRRPPRA